MNIDALSHDLAHAAGIPAALVPSVVRRAHETQRAVERLSGYRPAGKGAEIMVRRVVARAVADHARGVLERVVLEV